VTTIVDIVKIFSFFPRFIEDNQNEHIIYPMTKETFKEVVFSFQREKIPNLDNWQIQFYTSFYYYIEDDLLVVVEESKSLGKVLEYFKSIFLSINPKNANPNIFKDFRLILLCNSIYRIISKLIPRRIKPYLSKAISSEEFGFLSGRQIHDIVVVALESLHTIKTKKLPSFIIKLDLSKVYDRVSWLCFRLMLINVGLSIPSVNWIEGC